jgi:hypothetical protein
MEPFDLSYKDKKYFIDHAVYNCPFCRRRNVKYEISDSFEFDWSLQKTCYGYIVRCLDCTRESLHLSWFDLVRRGVGFANPAVSRTPHEERYGRVKYQDVPLKNKDGSPMDIDDAIFHKQPSSYFTIDPRIPESVRKPLNEADNCRANKLIIGSRADLPA